jgi:hypothetical protein
MSAYDDLVTKVIAMREAQKAREEQPTRSNDAECKKTEMRVDTFIGKYIADRVQLELWSRMMQTDESAGAYNVTDESEKQKGGAT